MRPFTAGPSRESSSKERTSTTGAVRPPAGVATLPPRALTARTEFPASAGSTIAARSTAPRTQRSTVTGSSLTFSKPSSVIIARMSSTPAAAPGDPVRRGPTEVSLPRSS